MGWAWPRPGRRFCLPAQRRLWRRLPQGHAFVGFSGDQRRLEEMLRQMAGSADGVRDALTRYTQPVTGAYYTVPSVLLARFAPPEED